MWVSRQRAERENFISSERRDTLLRKEDGKDTSNIFMRGD